MAPRIAGVFKTADGTRKLLQGIEALTSMNVMVGVPDDKSERREGTPINNAALAYIHDKGAPEANIPARPFMEPGIKAVQDQITEELAKAGKSIFRGANTTMVNLNRIGIIATRSIKSKIGEGIPPPLADSTIRGRINRVKSKTRRAKLKAELAAGTAASRQNGAEGLFTPLVVTGQLRNAITYVVRKLRKGEK